jgi:hypothetical protein
MNQAVANPTRSTWAGIALFVDWAVACLPARLALDKDLAPESKGLRIGAALFPVIPAIAFLRAAASRVRGLDELHRRVRPFLPCFYFLGLAIAWRRYK